MALLNELEPDRFQKLCQSLLAAERPNVRCLPVGQADGGLDIVVPTDGQGFIAFQVKTARHPEELKDRAQWLINAMEKELPKVQALQQEGLQEYVVMTNVRGTAKPKTGSIDRVEAFLESSIGVPATCLWFDDIERRLEGNEQIKWRYPELLMGSDVIARLFETDLTESRQRRERAFRLFIEQQATTERTLKFKQTELYGGVFDLYVDVQCALRASGHRVLSQSQSELLARDDLDWRGGADSPRMRQQEMRIIASGRERRVLVPQVPVARFILNVLPYAHQSVVIEGAPGQGKSTVGQYVCQIHRQRLLDQQEELTALPRSHARSALRIPIRLDLRDVASWIQEESQLEGEQIAQSAKELRSIETLIAALVSNYAGGVEFDVNDLHAAIEGRDVLLVFDGLDEVADIDARADVVREVDATIRRLRGTAKTLHSLITSRPAAFANSPGFPENEYPYVVLHSLDRELIESYGSKWVRARNFEQAHADEILTTLRLKLAEAHIRELAHNPMQLAILLSLISARGNSLPDKRTALYDAYMDVFFSREADKNEIVRRYRDLLQELHGFLAWHLHSLSELGRTTGRIPVEELLLLLREYLQREDYNPELAETLFQGAVERVVALVSRIEGTYEFDVQPIREYYGAKYLHDGAPQSRVGREEPGAKPDRFEALAQNPYWLNVARFYAGAYTKGELGGLVDSLEVVQNDEAWSLGSHPRLLTRMLLADYVFSQSAAATKRVVAILTKGLGVRHVLSGSDQTRGVLELPEEAGRALVRRGCLDLLLAAELPFDRGQPLVGLTVANGSQEEVAADWLARAETLSGEALSDWFDVGAELRVLGSVSRDSINAFLSEDRDSRVRSLIESGGNDYYEQNEQDALISLTLVSDLRVGGGGEVHPSSGRAGILSSVFGALNRLTTQTQYLRYQYHRVATDDPLVSVAAMPSWASEDDPDPLTNCASHLLRLVRDPVENWLASMDLWIEALNYFKGARLPSDMLASALALTAAQTVRSSRVLPVEELEVARRLARSTQPRTWRVAWDGEQQRNLVVAAYLAFARPASVWELREDVEAFLQEMPVSDYEDLLRLVDQVRYGAFLDMRRHDDLRASMSEWSVRFQRAMWSRLDGVEQSTLLERGDLVRDDEIDSPIQLEAKWRQDLKDARLWSEALPVISKHFPDREFLPNHWMPAGLRRRLLPDQARDILTEPETYPLWLVELAQLVMDEVISRSALKLASIASENNWFRVEDGG